MADYTWDRAGADNDWENVNNWGGVAYPGDGDDALFDNAALEMPDTNLPTTGTIGFVFTADITVTLSDLVNGATIGDVTVNSNGAYIINDGSAGTINIADGVVEQSATGTVSFVVSGAGAELYISGTTTITGTITDGGAGGNVYADPDGPTSLSTTFTTGTIVLNLDGGSEWVGDVIGNVTCFDDTTGTREITGDLTLSATGTLDTSVDAETFFVDGNLVATNGSTIIGNAGGTVEVSGNYSRAGPTGTVTNLHLRMTGTGTAHSIYSSDYPLSFTVASTAVTTLDANMSVKKLVVEAGGEMTGAGALHISYPSVDFIDIAGTVSNDIAVQQQYSRNNSGDIITSGRFTYRATLARSTTMVQSGVLSAGSTLVLSGNYDNEIATLICTGASVVAGDVTLGFASGTDRAGALDVSGVSGAVTIGDLVDAAGGSSALVLGAKDITLDGDWDGTDIAVTASGTVTGDDTMTLSNMGDPGAVVKVYGGVVDDGSNHENWVFSSDDVQSDNEKGGALRRSLQGAA